jgi:hypothetical protein
MLQNNRIIEDTKFFRFYRLGCGVNAGVKVMNLGIFGL